jgi:hypothetical protein
VEHFSRQEFTSALHYPPLFLEQFAFAFDLQFIRQ